MCIISHQLSSTSTGLTRYSIFNRQNTGGSVIEETSHISHDALHRSQDELANHTGDTDSEDDGVIDGDDDEEGNHMVLDDRWANVEQSFDG